MAFFKLLSGENWEIYTIDGAVPCEDIQVVHIKHPKWKTISKLPPMGRKPVRLPLLVHPSTADATQRTSFLPPWKEDDWEFCLHCFLSLLYLSNPIEKNKQTKNNRLETSKNFKYKDILSQSRTSSNFSAAPMSHTPSHNHWTES